LASKACRVFNDYLVPSLFSFPAQLTVDQVRSYLDNHAYTGEEWSKGSPADKHGHVEEYLQEELKEGWRIASLCGFGGAEGINARGWLAVVLEK